jgi:hypothetical protein
METKFKKFKDGQKLKLYPSKDNPLHKKPVICTYINSYYYCEGTTDDMPDYHFDDVAVCNKGYDLVSEH